MLSTTFANHDVAPVSLTSYATRLISTRHQLSYYNSLIVVAARTYGASYLLTEASPPSRYEGVRILHVLDADFDLSRLD